MLTPGERRSELQITLRGDLGTILEWTGNGDEKGKTDTPSSGMSVSVVAGVGFEPTTFRHETRVDYRTHGILADSSGAIMAINH